MDLRDRFRGKVRVLESGCWQWLMCKDKQGYGWCGFVPGTKRAHRAAYMLFKGPIPEGSLVLHDCDNSSCVNPAHLSLGTHAENQSQKAARNRSLKGERNHNARLTADIVLGIYRDQRPQAAIAKEYGVLQSTVGRIKLGQVWSHVTGHVPERPGHFRGPRSYQAKLSAADVREIRHSAMTLRELSEKFGISKASVHRVKHRKNYKEVA